MAATGYHTSMDEAQLANRIARVFRHRRKWANRSGVTCFRVYDHDIPDQPLIVDWYDGDAVVWTFDRTRNETPDMETAWLAAVDRSVAQGLGLPQERIHRKVRRRQKDRQEGDGQYHRLGAQQVAKDVLEHGLTFRVNLSDYLDTGLFLDHRPLRRTVRTEVAGKHVLNLFAYTGSFTVAAAVGGAASTTTVDLSNTYLEWAEANLRRNGVAGGAHDFIKADCLRWLAAAPPRRFDRIICDPPTFSNSTAMTTSWSVQRDHPWLLERLYAFLAPGGVAWFSTNAKGFKLVETGLPPFAEVTDMTAATIDEDFTGRTPHRCWRLVR
jgi:23S rRNA (cytosine1962-C5)-methyltransferase